MRLSGLPVVVLCLLPPAGGQTTVSTVHVSVLNGRNGKPVKHARATVNVYPTATYETPVSFTTDLHGVFTMLVEHAGEISARVDEHRPCERLVKADRKQPPAKYPVSQIESTGVVSTDNCGHRSANPQPGTLTLYVRPTHWWQGLL